MVPSIVAAAVYNPPKAPMEKKLLDHIAQTVTLLKAKYLNCGFLICGDFNKADISCILDRELVNVVRQPTRGQNTLDLIISNLRRFYQTITIMPPVGKSDHSTVLWKPTSDSRQTGPKQTLHTRPITDSATRSFGQWITAYDWKPVLDATSTQAKADTFYEILGEQIEAHFPMEKTKCVPSDKPWMSTKIKNLILK